MWQYEWKKNKLVSFERRFSAYYQVNRVWTYVEYMFGLPDSVADGEESEFEDEMEDMVGDLDVASRLLDRNLQDVLTRIPDHELTQLFDAPGKSC